MSKFFNHARATQQTGVATAPADTAQLDQLVATLRESHSHAVAVSEHRLQDCPKLFLAQSSDTLVSHFSQRTGALMEAYRMLRTKLLHKQTTTGFRSICVSSSVAGEGKTFTTVNLGICCAAITEYPVLVVDADLRTHGLSHLVKKPQAVGLSDVLAGRADLESAIFATDLPNLYVLTGGTVDTAPPELFSSKRWKELMGWCTETFKLVLVDAPPILPLTDYDLISSNCDASVLVVRALRADKDSLQQLAGGLDQKKLVGVVFNDAEDRSKRYYGYYGKK